MSDERARTFDAVAEQYDEVRPGYPDALVDTIVADLPGDARLLEVGCGTGKATAAFVARGFDVHCVEPGENLAAVARRNFPGLAVDVSTFEDWPEPDERFDVVYSAQAWHWVDKDVGYDKVKRLLGPGGTLAVYWNMYPRYMTELATALMEVYREHAPEMTTPHLTRPIPERIAERAEEIQQRFGPVDVHRFEWDQHLDRDSYIKLIDTYSNHRILPPDRQQRLYEGVAKTIDAFGGEAVRPYWAILFIARTPSAPEAGPPPPGA